MCEGQNIVSTRLFQELWLLYIFITNSLKTNKISFFKHISKLNIEFLKLLQSEKLVENCIPEKIISQILDLHQLFITDDKRPWSLYLFILEIIAKSGKMTKNNFKAFFDVLNSIVNCEQSKQNDIELLIDVIKEEIDSCIETDHKDILKQFLYRLEIFIAGQMAKLQKLIKQNKKENLVFELKLLVVLQEILKSLPLQHDSLTKGSKKTFRKLISKVTKQMKHGIKHFEKLKKKIEQEQNKPLKLALA